MKSSDFKIVFHPLAEVEYLEAIEWYVNVRVELAELFLAEVENLLAGLKSFPYSYPTKHIDIREAPLPIFPYLIIYKIDLRRTEIFILSVFHESKNPVRKRIE